MIPFQQLWSGGVQDKSIDDGEIVDEVRLWTGHDGTSINKQVRIWLLLISVNK